MKPIKSVTVNSLALSLVYSLKGENNAWHGRAGQFIEKISSALRGCDKVPVMFVKSPFLKLDFMRSHLCISALDLKTTDKQCRTCYVEQSASWRCSEELFICFSDRKHGRPLSGKQRLTFRTVCPGEESRVFTLWKIHIVVFKKVNNLTVPV